MSERHSRQERCPVIGPVGQQRIAQSHVLIVGIGALGSHTADALARAGCGHLTMIDRDVVELHNLQRQVLFDEADAHQQRPKALAAAERLRRVDPSIRIDAIVDEFGPHTLAALEDQPSLILDGTDNFSTRMLINDLAVRDVAPWIYGGAVGTTGRVMTIVPGRTPCLRCLMPAAPPTGETDTCETAGILSCTIAQVAALQVSEAMKLLVNGPDAVESGMWFVESWDDPRIERRLRHSTPDPSCRSCGTRELPALAAAANTGETSTVMCGRDVVQIRPAAGVRVDLTRLANGLREHATSVEESPHWLRFEADHCRFTVFAGGRTLVFGTRDVGRARALYDRYVGA